MDRFIGEYKIVSGYSLENLAENVNKAIEEGYQPFGCMTIGKEDYLQTVVRYGIF